MNIHSAQFDLQLAADVSSLVGESKTGAELIDALGGIHPIDLKRALISAGRFDLVEQVFSDLAVTEPFLLEIARDDNPVLSFWPFSSRCAQEVAEFSRSYNSIGLLGTPTVFGLLRGMLKEGVVLFDSDDYLFRDRAADGFVRCDVPSEVSSQFANAFDLVVVDPPWYFEEYCAWLDTAIRVVRPGATLVFVLYPPNIRESAKNEREKLLRMCQGLLQEVRQLSVLAEYETPSFEKVQLICNGIAPVNWRTASFVAAKVPHSKVTFSSTAKSNSASTWLERRIGCGRIFINEEAASNSTFLEAAEPPSRFLSSPSRRNPARKKANVISSRGHGLCCSDPMVLVKLIEGIHEGSDIEKTGYELDADDGRLLRSVASDLWSRFITI